MFRRNSEEVKSIGKQPMFHLFDVCSKIIVEHPSHVTPRRTRCTTNNKPQGEDEGIDNLTRRLALLADECLQ